jgi:hypothetical protein
MIEYPQRMSTDEMRLQLDPYLRARAASGRDPETIKVDRRKIEFFLRYLDTGQVPGSLAPDPVA